MATTLIRGGASFDHVTPDEMRGMLGEQAAIESARDRERYRGIKDLRRSINLSSPAGAHITINDGITPEAGYKWLVMGVSVWLAAAGTGEAFITSDTASALAAPTQGRPVITFSTSFVYQVGNLPKGACVLNEGEGLYLNFSQNIQGYMLTGWLTPAELIGRFA